jgi:hypothetical protein
MVKKGGCLLKPLFSFFLMLLFLQIMPAADTYFVKDNLRDFAKSSVQWNSNGAALYTDSGLSITDPAGGSYIFTGTPPDRSNQYEVATTLTLSASGGTYVLYLEASPDALLGFVPMGSFYAFAIELLP